MHREKWPEKVPFRLTRMLVKAMEVGGIEGTFRSTCESVMGVMRQNEDSLMAILEAFVHDPLMNWKLLEKTNVESSRAIPANGKMEEEEEEEEEQEQEEEKGEEESEGRKEKKEKKEKKRTMAAKRKRERQHGEEEIDQGNQTSAKAAAVIKRVRDKLTGNDFYEDEKISVSEQVRQLILQATSRYNLCQSYMGW